MKVSWLVAVLVLLAGCGQNRSEALAACRNQEGDAECACLEKLGDDEEFFRRARTSMYMAAIACRLKARAKESK